eukprot:jgi/Chlat1/7902/Chrsp66S07323
MAAAAEVAAVEEDVAREKGLVRAATWQVVRVATLSRLLVLLLVFAGDWLVQDYDSSAAVVPPCLVGDKAEGLYDHGHELDVGHARGVLPSLVKWDGVHFARIARCGYEYEQMFAFFPLMPAVMLLWPFRQVLSLHDRIVIAGLLLSNGAFIMAAVSLFRLGVELLKDVRVAQKAAVLYSFNPASVFHSTLYSESVYAACAFLGLLCLAKRRRWPAAGFFALTSATRSNGVLHCGYFLFDFLQALQVVTLPQALRGAVHTLALCSLTAAPVILFQYFGSSAFCSSEGLQRPWCQQKLPYIYGFVQKEYWNVGLFRYYEVKQVPNFVLALPILVISAAAVISYWRRDPLRAASLGLWSNKQLPGDALGGGSRGKDVDTAAINAVGRALGSAVAGYYADDVQCQVYHLAFLLAVCLTVLHVQVSTRFLSACAPIYWFLAQQVFCKTRSRWLLPVQRAIAVYAFTFIIAGTILHVNFLPFT